jgi:cyclopropane fatty-acyl-phospholipid synthase-like methyltransferase
MTDDPRIRLVAEGYNAIVDRHLSWIGRIDADPRMRWLEEFTARLAAGGDVLELGCGAGVPITARLAERFTVTGIDVSPGQIARARELVPAARLIVGDMTTIEMPAASFDGVAAFYSILHVPRERHAALFGRIAGWLRPGGWFVAAFSGHDDPGWTGRWLGVPMFFSGFAPNVTASLLSDAGFRVVRRRLETMREPEEDGTLSDATFLWVLARRRQRQGATAQPDRSA